MPELSLLSLLTRALSKPLGDELSEVRGGRPSFTLFAPVNAAIRAPGCRLAFAPLPLSPFLL